VEFTVLGALAVSHEGGQVPLGSRKQRAVLAILLLRANEVVTPDSLIDELWGEHPPPSAAHTLQVYVSRLRAGLRAGRAPEDVLVTRPSGYMLRVGFHELDLDRFEHLAAEGRRALEAGSPDRAADKLREALGIWKGAPLADLAFEPFARVDVERLEERRLAAREDRIEADLALGRHDALVAELKGLVERHPMRERLRGQLMLALYRAGRHADALATYREARDHLVGELGLEPSKALRALEQAVLRQDASLDRAPAIEEQSSVVTVVSDPAAHGSDAWADGPPSPARHKAPPGDEIRSDRRARGHRNALVGVAAIVVGVAAVALATHDSKRADVLAASDVHANAIVFVDTAKLTPVAQEETAGRPAGMAAGAGSLWVSDAANDRVLRLDPQTHRIEDRIPVGRDPSGIAASSRGVWVANTGGRTVSEIRPESGTVVATVPVGNAPVAVASGAGAIWVADASDGTLTRIDPLTATAVATIQLGQPLSDVAVGLSAVWASSASSGLLIRVDPASNRPVRALSVGNGPSSIAFAEGAVWVANPPDGTVSRVDPISGAVRKINVSHPRDLASGAGALWVARTDRLDVVRIQPRTGAIVGTIPIGAPPAAIAELDGTLAVAALASSASHRGGTLRVVGGDALDSIDPGQAYSAIGWQLLSLTNDGLLTYARSAGPAGATIVPDLATSVPVAQDRGRAFTFQLRPGVRYSTGAPVRPEDFRIALERQFRASTGLAALGVPIRGAERCTPTRCDLSAGVAVDDASQTITYRLARPDPAFLYELALPFGSAVPAGAQPISATRALPATGPYRIARYVPGREVVLRRNARFRPWSDAARPSGFPDTITLTLGYGAASQAAAVAGGRADVMLDSPPPGSLAGLGQRWPVQLHSYTQPEVHAMFLNTRLAPFDRPAVRRALELAVDRRAIMRLAGGPKLARPTCQILPPSFPGYRPFCPYTADPTPAGLWRAPDLARARRLIAGSGTHGMAVRVSTIADDPGKLATGRYFVRLLRRLGYRASMRRYATAHAYYSVVGMARSRSQIGVLDWAADYQAGSAFFQPLFTCEAYRPTMPLNLNAAGICDPALDHEIAHATRLQTTNAAAANTAWQRIDRRVTGRAAWIPLVAALGIDFVAPRVGNYQRNPAFGVLLDQLWVR
jgi:DNA-binding SARP family transcriptional activator/ABC-type transport system substrate-binding protein